MVIGMLLGVVIIITVSMWFFYPVKLFSYGIRGSNFSGIYRTLKWNEINSVDYMNHCGIEYFLLTSSLQRSKIYIPLFLENIKQFYASLKEHAGEDHPLTVAVKEADIQLPNLKWGLGTIGTLCIAGLLAISLNFYFGLNFKPLALKLKAEGNILFEQGQLQKALQKYKASLKEDPSLAVNYYNIGNIYAQWDQREKAISHYEEAIQRGYKSNKVYWNLGYYHYKWGNYSRSIANYEVVHKKIAHGKDVLLNLGLAYKKNHQFKKAKETFEKSIELYPNDERFKDLLEDTNREINK